MRFVRVINVRFINITCDVGARIAERCITQIYGCGFSKILRFFVVVFAVSLFSHPFVYISFAADGVFIDGTSTSVIDAKTDTSKLSNYAYSRVTLILDPTAVEHYFHAVAGDTIVFTLESVNIAEPSVISGDPKFTDLTTGITDHVLSLSYVPVGSSSPTSFNITAGDKVTIPYGGGNISISSQGTWVGRGEVSYTSRLIANTPFYTYAGAKWSTTTRFTFTNVRKVLSDNDALNQINDKTQEHIDQDKQYHDEDIAKGEESGSDASKMVTDLTDQVKTKWEILFYPIEFTKKFLSLFTGSSGGATSITFPAFSLTVDGSSYQVWEEYTYDLSSLKSQFSVLFTGLHMIVGVLEVGWFIKYLYRKYDEVFGGGES